MKVKACYMLLSASGEMLQVFGPANTQLMEATGIRVRDSEVQPV